MADKNDKIEMEQLFENQKPALDYTLMENKAVLVQRTIRSGQTLQYPGHIVILGDVNPGAEIIAGGNIIVMGSLRGIAHAGAEGSSDAVVAAFRLEPTQLRIANHITRAPDGEKFTPEYPEVARVRNEVVVIEKVHSLREHYLALCQS
jgi:septum site-determining protein MinC